MTTPENPTQQTADDYMRNHIQGVITNLQATFAEVAAMRSANNLEIEPMSACLTYEGDGRAKLVEEAEEATGTKVSLFQPGINPTYRSNCGRITVAFK